MRVLVVRVLVLVLVIVLDIVPLFAVVVAAAAGAVLCTSHKGGGILGVWHHARRAKLGEIRGALAPGRFTIAFADRQEYFI